MGYFNPDVFYTHLTNYSIYRTAQLGASQPDSVNETEQGFMKVMTAQLEGPYLESFAYLDNLSSQYDASIEIPTEEHLLLLKKSLEKNPSFARRLKSIWQSLPGMVNEWKEDYQLYKQGNLPLQQKYAMENTSRSGPRSRPKELFSIHSSSPVYDIGETIARGTFNLDDDKSFPSADIIGATQGRLELLPFWDHENNRPISPQNISLVSQGDGVKFNRLQEEALRISTSYNEEMATYFYAMDAYWLTKATNANDYVELQISDLLQYSGKKPVKTHGKYTGTFRPDQLQRAGLMVYGMGFSMVEIERSTIKGVGERSHYKRLWDVTDVYVMQTLDNEKYIESMTYRPNEFFRNTSFGSRRETALLMSKVLSLDYAKMVTARRLGRYYTWLWRNRAYHGDICAPISCALLLERTGVEIVKGQERYARRSLENALDRLENEEIIAQWVLLDSENKPVDTGKRISFAQWLEMKISVSPPDVIVLHYANGIGIEVELEPQNIDREKLKRERKRMGYTLAMLSEETQIELSTLSRIEAGKTKRPRAEHVKKINKWLETAAKK